MFFTLIYNRAGMGYPWLQENFNVGHGLFAASFLSTILRNSESLGIRFSNYFEPIGEGALKVYPYDVKILPTGNVMGMYSKHQGRKLIKGLPDQNKGEDLEFTASIGNDGDVLLHVANRNFTDKTFKIEATKMLKETMNLTLLQPDQLQNITNSVFVKKTLQAKTNETVTIPAFSVAQIVV